MKKVFALLFVAGVLAFAACTKKVEETTVETPAVDTTAVAVDSSAAPIDSAAAVPADSAK